MDTGHRPPSTSRRHLLIGAALTPLAVAAAQMDRPPGGPSPVGTGEGSAPTALGQEEARLVHSANPPLEETPLSALRGLITPTRLHFVRNHSPTPQIDPATWTLAVDGEVDRPLTLSYADLLRLPSISLNILLECAGNSRSRFSPTVSGTQWGDGAVSVAEWTGVPLSTVLQMAGIRANAVDVVARGADAGQVERGLPVGVALGPDLLLAYAMNGETLPAPHGFPLRLVVPGWVGIASIKWLEQLTVLPHPYEGLYQTVQYRLQGPDYPTEPQTTLLPVKSAIARPAAGAMIPPGPRLVSGFAWSGLAPIVRVEVSLDDGATWADARLLGTVAWRHWTRWDFPWDAPAGQHTLLSRAWDVAGAVQPSAIPWNRQGYLYHATIPVPIGVAEPAAPPASQEQSPPLVVAAPPAPSAEGALGSSAYSTYCASCHGATGDGTRLGPPVIGSQSNVRAYTPQQLDAYVRAAMPLDAPGSLSDEQYRAVVDFLRGANQTP